MCNKAVDNYLYALELLPECFDSKMCDKAVNTYPSTTKFVCECYKTQEMCNEVVNRFSLYL